MPGSASPMSESEAGTSLVAISAASCQAGAQPTVGNPQLSTLQLDQDIQTEEVILKRCSRDFNTATNRLTKSYKLQIHTLKESKAAMLEENEEMQDEIQLLKGFVETRGLCQDLRDHRIAESTRRRRLTGSQDLASHEAPPAPPMPMHVPDGLH